MAVSNRAKLPLLFSALTGLCVLGLETWVLLGLMRLSAEIWQILCASVFALIVCAVWFRGFLRSVQILSRYAQEEKALPKAKADLEALARDVEAGNWNRQNLQASTPLLDKRLTRVCKELRRGAPLLPGELSASEDHFPLPEREIRNYREIALQVGIAGAVFSILIALGQPHVTSERLLAQAGPALAGGLAAVIANIGLRLCYRAVQDEQAVLAAQVDAAVSDGFVSALPTAVTSPEERVAAATRELALHATATLEAQNAATHVTLTQQAEQYDTLLKSFGRQITTLLVQQIQQPIQQIADSSGVLAKQSGTWAASVSDLKTAHLGFLNAQKEGQAQHEQRLATTFAQYHRALDLSLLVVKQANEAALEQTQEFTKRLAALHMQELIEMTSQIQGRYAALQAEQEAVHQRLTEAAVTAMSGAIETRLASLDERVAATLAAVESRLPTTLRDGVHEGLGETILLIDSVREQTAGMAHTLGQISGNADRQLQAYERWNERALSVQGRLEQVVTDGQAAQAAQLAHWQAEATQTLEGVRAAFDGTIYTAQSGFTNLVTALDPLTAELQRLQFTAQELRIALTSLSPRLTDTASISSEAFVMAPALNNLFAANSDGSSVPDHTNGPASALPEWARPDAANLNRDV